MSRDREPIEAATDIAARFDSRLDLRDLLCPLPVLKTRKALRGMAAGARLLVEATDPMTLIDLPHCCVEDGHVLLAKETKDGVHRFLIERGGRH